MSDIAQIISTVGFPIASFLIAAYFIKYTYDKADESNKKALDSVQELSIAVTKNTDTLAQLVSEVKELNDNSNKED